MIPQELDAAVRRAVPVSGPPRGTRGVKGRASCGTSSVAYQTRRPTPTLLNEVSPTTVENYTSFTRRDLLTYFGAKPVDTITTETVEDFIGMKRPRRQPSVGFGKIAAGRAIVCTLPAPGLDDRARCRRAANRPRALCHPPSPVDFAQGCG